MFKKVKDQAADDKKEVSKASNVREGIQQNDKKRIFDTSKINIPLQLMIYINDEAKEPEQKMTLCEHSS